MKTLFKNGKIYNTKTKSFVDGEIAVENGFIVTESNPDKVVDLGGAYVMPGLIDVHTHGRVGIEANLASYEDFITMSHSYAAAGTTSYMPTLTSVSDELVNTSIHNISAVMERQQKEYDGANILGVHFEGRYLNLKRKGAHNPDYIMPPKADEIEEFINRARGAKFPIDRFHVICAPELEGAEAFIKKAVSMGATVSIGHSAADFEDCQKGVEWGATAFTHIYNAMSPLTHREPGCVGAAMTFTNTFPELICDGYHVTPTVVAITAKTIEHSRLVLITDSVAAAGLPAGEFTDGGGFTVITDGKICKLPDGTIAGSVIDMFSGLMNFMKFTGISLEEAIPYATINPARMVKADNIVGSLELGKYADFIVLADGRKSIDSVYVRGNLIK